MPLQLPLKKTAQSSVELVLHASEDSCKCPDLVASKVDKFNLTQIAIPIIFHRKTLHMIFVLRFHLGYRKNNSDKSTKGRTYRLPIYAVILA